MMYSMNVLCSKKKVTFMNFYNAIILKNDQYIILHTQLNFLKNNLKKGEKSYLWLQLKKTSRIRGSAMVSQRRGSFWVISWQTLTQWGVSRITPVLIVAPVCGVSIGGMTSVNWWHYTWLSLWGNLDFSMALQESKTKNICWKW